MTRTVCSLLFALFLSGALALAQDPSVTAGFASVNFGIARRPGKSPSSQFGK